MLCLQPLYHLDRCHCLFQPRQRPCWEEADASGVPPTGVVMSLNQLNRCHCLCWLFQPRQRPCWEGADASGVPPTGVVMLGRQRNVLPSTTDTESFKPLLLFMLFISASAMSLFGGGRCMWGPSYWCSDVRKAEECGAFNHRNI